MARAGRRTSALCWCSPPGRFAGPLRSRAACHIAPPPAARRLLPAATHAYPAFVPHLGACVVPQGILLLSVHSGFLLSFIDCPPCMLCATLTYSEPPRTCRLKGKQAPEGWELIEEVIDDFEQQMKDAVNEDTAGKRRNETTWKVRSAGLPGCRVPLPLSPRRTASRRRGLLLVQLPMPAKTGGLTLRQATVAAAAKLRCSCGGAGARGGGGGPPPGGGAHRWNICLPEHAGFWPLSQVTRIHWEKNRFIYDLMYNRKVRMRHTLVYTHMLVYMHGGRSMRQ